MKFFFYIIVFSLLISCVGSSTTGVFGSGVSIALDPRTLGTQIDDSIMQKNIMTRLILIDKKYIIGVGVKVIDGRIFITGKIDEPGEKLRITKLAWETSGARSVKNDLKIKSNFNFKSNAQDLLITSQLRAAIILNKKIKSANYNLDTLNKKIYIYGIAHDQDERKEIINEAKIIFGADEVIASIILVSDLSRQKN